VKTGTKPMQIQGIYGVDQLALPGNFIMSIAGYEQSFDTQLDALIYAKLAPGVTAEQGRAAIEPLLAQYPTAKLQDNTQYKQDQLKNLNALVNLVYGLLFFAVIIAFIGVVNTLALSIYERTHELGLLRAVGMSRSQVRSSIRWEAVLISLLGTLLGIVIGFFFGWACVRALADQGLNKFDPAVGTLIVLVIAAAILGVVSAIFPARRAAKLDVLRAVASE
jgi:putative ABC transport system permease protein